MQGPLDEMWLPEAIKTARDFKVDGILCWAVRGCRQQSSAYKVIVDAIKKEFPNISVAIIDSDYNDPAFISEEELKERVEQFLERI